MAASFSFEMPLNEWRRCLQDINFWLNGYLSSRAYRHLEESLRPNKWLQWTGGVGPTSSFTRAISSITREMKIRESGPFDYVIEVDMKKPSVLGSRLSINDKLHIKVSEQLGLLNEEYDRLKEMNNEELRYYDYANKTEDITNLLQNLLKSSIVPQMVLTLSKKKYLLVIENLDEPTNTMKITEFTEGLLLPPPGLKGSYWLVSTTSQDICDEGNNRQYCRALDSTASGDNIVMLTLYSLQQAAKHILSAIRHKDEQYWHNVAIQCFYYATMLLIPYCSSIHGDGDQQISDTPVDITSDELIRQWAMQSLITVVLERTEELTGGSSYHGKYNDIYHVGNVILEAFREYSLLQLPFSPATKADEPTKSAAHFLAFHSLIPEGHTTDDELFEGNHPALERMQWILHVGNQGWHVTRDFMSQRASGPTTLIVRNFSQQSALFMKLQSDHFLAKLSCLRVLDLSYTPLESLPPSICCLQKLQLLSLRGCYNLRSPFSFPDTEITLCENKSNKMLSLLHLDLSYSNINKFQSYFFHNMPNLKELLLVKCSNLEEMPPSIAALSSLTTLELTGTQIKSFPRDMFEEMKKLQSLRLTENKELLFAPGSVSKASGLIDLHIEGCESITEAEVRLERHPTLRSFSLVGAPHIKILSLHGCRKLEYVNINDVDALEELDLSATAIKELPANIPNLSQLRRLLLMGVPSLRRFPWHQLQRLPDVFYLDQCSERIDNHSNPEVVHVCISDSRFFYSFNWNTINLVRDGRLLKSFYVQVTSCKARTRNIEDEEDMLKTDKLQVALRAYDDVNHHYLTDGVSMVSMDDVPPFRKTERHVEISAVDRYPHGLNYLLQVTKSISMSHDTHVSCLNDLVNSYNELEECNLQWCHRMQEVFRYDSMRTLRHAFVSHLKSLTYFNSRFADFHALKHLRLEYCPRLEGVSSHPSTLPSLVTLDIRFCYNLKAIFYDSNDDLYDLSRLRRIHLQELPLLEHIHINNPILTAPAWEELHVRGCWSLRRLPRLDQQADKAVKVSGERAWWTKLEWDRKDDGKPSHRSSYVARLPPASASIRERVIIKTYLR